MPVDVHDSDEFRGARFTHADLSGARMHDVDLSGARITDAMLVDESAAAPSTSGPGRVVSGSGQVGGFRSAEPGEGQLVAFSSGVTAVSSPALDASPL